MGMFRSWVAHNTIVITTDQMNIVEIFISEKIFKFVISYFEIPSLELWFKNAQLPRRVNKKALTEPYSVGREPELQLSSVHPELYLLAWLVFRSQNLKNCIGSI